MKLSKTAGYISEIKEIIYKAREKAYTSVNLAMIEAYWLVGKRIVEEEQKGKEKANYGEALLKNLSIALTREIGKGFSYSNLRNFRQFYLTYPNYENCYALRSKLTWTHHRLIMRVEDPKTREFYIKECEEQNWSSRILERNINSLYFQRILSSKDKASNIKESDFEKYSVEDFIKDPYVFEFLNLPQSQEELESKIESALIQNLQKFLLELGKGFSFVARQFRISTETSHFYIDLVFYNYILKCFVLFDLKTSKLSHQDIGQLDMYVRMFDDLKRQESDNPTIGILLCTEKEETVVKYSVLNDNKQLYASKYMQYLPSEDELTREIEREKELIRKQLDKGNGI
jgi:predicted nuclease of restriction endonuclease-like (RecB) superfamily